MPKSLINLWYCKTQEPAQCFEGGGDWPTRNGVNVSLNYAIIGDNMAQVRDLSLAKVALRELNKEVVVEKVEDCTDATEVFGPSLVVDENIVEEDENKLTEVGGERRRGLGMWRARW